MPGVASAQRDGAGSGRGWLGSMLLFASDVQSWGRKFGDEGARKRPPRRTASIKGWEV